MSEWRAFKGEKTVEMISMKRTSRRTERRLYASIVPISMVLTAVLLAPPSPAGASYPGANGKIAFANSQPSTNNPADIWTMNPDGTGLTNLTPNSPADDSIPDWSPDGSTIAFVSDRDGGDPEIYVMNADGSSQTRLTSSPGNDTTPNWSPDGTRIAFASFRDGNGEIYLMDADGTNLRRLTDNPAFDINPHFSPDGEEILFASRRDGPAYLYLMKPDGTDVRRIPTDVPVARPDWSPDGQRIVASINSLTPRPSLVVFDADGSNMRTLATGGANAQVSWSPDGLTIAYAHGPAFPGGTKADVFLTNADGTGEPANLTHSPTATETFPDWGPA